MRRFEHPLAMPAFLVGGTVAIHLALHAGGYSLRAAQAEGWFPDLSAGAALPGRWLLTSLPAIDLREVLWSAGGYVGLIAVTAMTLLMSVMAIELETQLDIDLDKELRLNGLANLAVGLGGGMTGTLSLSRTLFNFRSGARGRTSGIMAGVICLLVLGFGTKALGYVPVPLMAALLLQLGISMLVEWLVRGWRTMQRTEYFEMAVIFGVTVAWDFVAGVVLGIITSCIAFAINTSRLRLLKLGLSRAVYSGSVDRPFYEQEQLVRYGHGIQIMWLHGFVFFGSAHRLLLQIREIVDVPGADCRSLILDFRQVMGIDSSAVMSLLKLGQIAERKGFDVVLAAVPPQVARGLRGLGWPVFPDTDSALEWCEEKLLTEVATSDEGRRSADNWLASEIGNEDLLPRFVSYLDVIEYKAGEYLIRQGDAGDSLYLLFAGRATVLLRTAQGAEVRLRTMVGHTIVGEMGLYRALPRGASVRADQVTIAYRMSSEAMAKMEAEDPALAYAFHKLVIRTLAARLDFANREVAGLRR
jgi:SulP family sulfate permease